MARVKYGSIVTELRGKLGGAVFQRCGQSLSMREHYTNKKSAQAPSVNARNIFREIVSRWSSLVTIDKASFSTNAASYPTYDKYGAPIVLSGFQLYVMLSTYLMHCVGAVVQFCNSYTPPTMINGFIGTWDISANSINFQSVLAIPADCYVLVYIAPKVRNQSNITNKKYAFCTALPESVTSGSNIYSFMNAGFRWNRTVGSVYYYKLIVFDTSLACYRNDVEGSFTFQA